MSDENFDEAFDRAVELGESLRVPTLTQDDLNEVLGGEPGGSGGENQPPLALPAPPGKQQKRRESQLASKRRVEAKMASQLAEIGQWLGLPGKPSRQKIVEAMHQKMLEKMEKEKEK